MDVKGFLSGFLHGIYDPKTLNPKLESMMWVPQRRELSRSLGFIGFRV